MNADLPSEALTAAGAAALQQVHMHFKSALCRNLWCVEVQMAEHSACHAAPRYEITRRHVTAAAAAVAWCVHDQRHTEMRHPPKRTLI